MLSASMEKLPAKSEPKAAATSSAGASSGAPDTSASPYAIVKEDPYLAPYEPAIAARANYAKEKLNDLETRFPGGLESFTQGWKRNGFTVQDSGDVQYREWAPGAKEVYLFGEFNNWDRRSHPCTPDDYGTWSLKLPAGTLVHNTKVKVGIVTESGEYVERLPPWINKTGRDGDNPTLDAFFWNPPSGPYVFKNERPPRPESLRIYEAHVGMATEEERCGTYIEFKDNVLPRIARLGYNTIQLMAVMEHSYYASFGYQITSFFAPACRSGSPEELAEMIDTAHGLGLTVLLDVVHSHASKNVLDGLNMFDGTDGAYFHAGPKGTHDGWDSRLFNYSADEVLRFLLSNLRYWIDVYGFDGFRFDAVTSMLYSHHGLGVSFANGYPDYFGPAVDGDGLAYLTVANEWLHSKYPWVITIAEDVSGYPGLCRTLEEGGVGFDYRLGMSIPDMWIKMLKEQKDDEWSMGNISWELCNRRWKEKTVAYAESHDQALVGDKTIAFWLMDKAMYTDMSTLGPLTPEVDRGMALHKLIRAVTYGAGGEAYLTFMGNEFGHPEWIDFPRPGNGWSYAHANRRFDLPRDSLLRYKFLENFEVALHRLEDSYHWLSAAPAHVSLKHEGDKMLVFHRAGLVFIFNWHPSQSYTDYRIGVPTPGTWKIVLHSDEATTGGHARLELGGEHLSTPEPWDDLPQFIQVYSPCRTLIVLAQE